MSTPQRADSEFDITVVGSGPNGLSAAIELASAGNRVLILEGCGTPGGGARTKQLTLPGFHHDVCAAVLPLALASPFFSALDLNQRGLDWIHPQIPLAHPMDDSETACLHRDLKQTAAGLGQDSRAYRRIFSSIIDGWPALVPELLGPMRIPRHPMLMSRFGWMALAPAERFAKRHFREERTAALFAGLAAHSMLALDRAFSSAFGLVLGALAHLVGWPFVAGGTQRLVDVLAEQLHDLGGELRTGQWVTELKRDFCARPALLDLSPRGVLELVGEQLPDHYRSKLQRFRYGPGVFKVDWALDGPVPWRDPQCRLAGTLHLGGTLEEIASAESQVWRGEHPDSPFVIFVQPSVFDDRRAPPGKHTAWAYCHVPKGSDRAMAAPIEAQVERFAPGFRDRILARSTMSAREMESYNPNYVGGDINVGVQDIRGHFLRPVPKLDPYRTPIEGLFLCSSATPPGGGLHGMCGYHAASSVLRWLRGRA